MGAQIVAARFVLDTNVVVLALVFPRGAPASLRRAWQQGTVVPLASAPTVQELMRVLAYPKFRLAADERDELLADYLPYAELVDRVAAAPGSLRCRDPDDQKFLDLAVTAACDGLVTGDGALLALGAHAPFPVITPAGALERLGRGWRDG